MAVAERDTDPLMQEIEDELRQEQMQKLWKAYGNYIIGVAVAVVAVVAGYQGWQAYERNSRQDETARLVGAAQLAESGKLEDAIESFKRIAEDGTTGVEVIAKLRAAALSAEKGDHAASQSLYEQIAADGDAPTAFREMATLLGAAQELETGTDKAADVLTKLEPLRADGHPLRHSAREYSAIAALQMGDKAKAEEFLKAIALDAEAPGGLRSRAEELLQAIGE